MNGVYTYYVEGGEHVWFGHAPLGDVEGHLDEAAEILDAKYGDIIAVTYIGVLADSEGAVHRLAVNLQHGAVDQVRRFQMTIGERVFTKLTEELF